jgi:hypothetical protein
MQNTRIIEIPINWQNRTKYLDKLFHLKIYLKGLINQLVILIFFCCLYKFFSQLPFGSSITETQDDTGYYTSIL